MKKGEDIMERLPNVADQVSSLEAKNVERTEGP